MIIDSRNVKCVKDRFENLLTLLKSIQYPDGITSHFNEKDLKEIIWMLGELQFRMEAEEHDK